MVAKAALHLDAAKPAHAVACGLSVTGLNVLAGVSGPLLDVFFVRTALTRHAIVATKAATQAFSHSVKMIFYGAPMLGAAQASGMPPWYFFVVAAPLAMLGAWLGGKVLDRYEGRCGLSQMDPLDRHRTRRAISRPSRDTVHTKLKSAAETTFLAAPRGRK